MAAGKKEHILWSAVADHTLTISLILLEAKDAFYLMDGAVTKTELTDNFWDAAAGSKTTRTASSLELHKGDFALCLYDR